MHGRRADDRSPPTDASGVVAPAAGADGELGLYRARDFRLATAERGAGPAPRQALWYFRGETIAVPQPGLPVATYTPGVSVVDDLSGWVARRAAGAPPEHPPLVWVGAPGVVASASLDFDAARLASRSGSLDFALAPRLSLNRSYFDASSARFFAARTVRLRGRSGGRGFVARTLWPEDFRLERAPPPRRLDAGLPGPEALRALVRADPAGGAREPYAAWTLWQRDPAHAPLRAGRAVLALILDGAQGDDDEAHGGHFALVTGRTRADGAIGDWMVNNFYALDSVSEKGIVAAPVPLDNYLADLNSGQNWYRPSHLLVAVLADDAAAALVQAALNRVYIQLWRHQLVYRHATMNCASISVDALRTLGWGIPARGPASRVAAALGFPWFVLREGSLERARVAFDYLNEDQTRLLPAAAFEEAGASLLGLAAASAPGTAAAVAPDAAVRDARHRRDGLLAGLLARDLEAIAFVRFPQFPSSRAFGDAAAVTPREYRARVPADPGRRQIVPVPPRPFPDDLRDPDLLPPRRAPSDWAAIVWGALLLVGIPLFLRRRWAQRRRRACARTAQR